MPTNFRVKYATMDDLVVAYSGNLSRGGLFLKSDDLLEVGSEVTITLELPDGAPEVAVVCKVVFAREEGVRGMGVKFVDPDEKVRERLERFILNEAAGTSDNQGESARKLDVVVVDDDPLQSRHVAEAFRERGDKVRTARDGLDGLALCLKETPDVILTDVQMPRMDGWQFVRMLRARPAFLHVPIIFLTTLTSDEDRLLGYRLGVDDYLPKPVEPAELIMRIDRAVKRAEQHAEQRNALEGDEEAVPSAGERSLAGDLDKVGMASILSFLEVERRSGILHIGPGLVGRLWLSDGRPVRAVVDRDGRRLEGTEACFALLDLRHGRFEFVQAPVDEQDEIQTTTSALLLEHARRADEAASEKSSKRSSA